ncbi:MAG: hypothetical protein NTW87_13355 [Planctomycetota bacterium]|nr:hypothetical protein [Planctomycetota bacterium]
MRPEELRELLDTRPFVRFRIHLSDGHHYDIRHPELALLTRSTLHIGVARRGSLIADEVIRVSLLHIVRVDSVERAAQKAS